MKGKVAIVTASSTGIGKAIAKKLAQEGCKVVISSRNKRNVEQAVEELVNLKYDVIGTVCDVGKASDRKNLISKTIQKYGKLDYIVGNAGFVSYEVDIFKTNEDDIRKMWQINYLSNFLLIKEALPFLRQNSSIVFISSQLAYDASDIIGHYGATKLALVRLTKALAKAFQKNNIRVNCVSPGLIKTDFSKPLWQGIQDKAAQRLQINRLGKAEQVGSVVKFLLSDDASYITGESILVAGKSFPKL